MTHKQALQQLKQNANWYLILGILLIIVGTLALFYAFYSTLFSVIYIGALLISVGLFEGITAFKLNQWGNFLLRLAISVISITAGLFIIAYPAINAVTLTLLLAGYLIAAGVFKIYVAITKNIPHKNWLIFNGILTILLGILIWAQWPLSGFWIIGTLLGIDAIFTGWTWVMLALQAKKVIPQ